MNILWLSDYKASDHIGGAELSNEALLEATPPDFSVEHIHVHRLDSTLLEQITPNLIIVDSITRLSRPNLLLEWFERIPYLSIEYDYNKTSRTRNLVQPGNRYLKAQSKWCRFHHRFWTHPNRKHSFFMSTSQMMIHYWLLAQAQLPIDHTTWSVLSSVFSCATFELIDRLLAEKGRGTIQIEDSYLISDTPNRLKGTREGIEYAEQMGLAYELFSDLDHEQLLRKMIRHKGLIHLPTMHDTCPRIVLEAAMLGLEVITNDLAQHTPEAWYDLKDRERIREHLAGRARHFWEQVRCLETPSRPT
jgi:hypothetical protein